MMIVHFDFRYAKTPSRCTSGRGFFLLDSFRKALAVGVKTEKQGQGLNVAAIGQSSDLVESAELNQIEQKHRKLLNWEVHLAR